MSWTFATANGPTTKKTRSRLEIARRSTAEKTRKHAHTRIADFQPSTTTSDACAITKPASQKKKSEHAELSTYSIAPGGSSTSFFIDSSSAIFSL